MIESNNKLNQQQRSSINIRAYQKILKKYIKKGPRCSLTESQGRKLHWITIIAGIILLLIMIF